MFRMRGEMKRAADTFIKASNCDEKNSFKAALLFEQAAFCYLQMNQLRKFAFLMILAGYRYSYSNQIKHAFRCYRSSLRIYYNYDDSPKEEQNKWEQIFEHMSITMGRLSVHMNDLLSSVVYMHDFVRNSKQLPDIQKSYMLEFMTTVKQFLSTSRSEEEFTFLDIPTIDHSSFRVLTSEYGSMCTRFDEFPEGKWKELEESLVKGIRGKMYMFKWDSPLTKSRIETGVVNGMIIVSRDVLHFPRANLCRD